LAEKSVYSVPASWPSKKVWRFQDAMRKWVCTFFTSKGFSQEVQLNSKKDSRRIQENNLNRRCIFINLYKKDRTMKSLLPQYGPKTGGCFKGALKNAGFLEAPVQVLTGFV